MGELPLILGGTIGRLMLGLTRCLGETVSSSFFGRAEFRLLV